MAATDFGFAVQNSAAHDINMRSLRRCTGAHSPSLFVVFGQGVEERFQLLRVIGGWLFWFVRGHVALGAFTQDGQGPGGENMHDKSGVSGAIALLLGVNCTARRRELKSEHQNAPLPISRGAMSGPVPRHMTYTVATSSCMAALDLPRSERLHVECASYTARFYLQADGIRLILC